MKYALLYIATIVLVNAAFDHVPLLSLPGGELWSPVSLGVGLVFVIRDYVQRNIGHLVLPAMLAGGAISWFLSTPAIAFASVCAFFAGEALDWGVYTFSGRPFSQRILISSTLGTPVDSIVFLALLGIFSVPSALIMTLGKMCGAVVVYLFARRREPAARRSCRA
ncbi:MAG: VUT family protein [Deltaproteobacteria bacterium]|jgi:uncharacterized PurR-regulated membrane protein YhhQ (DUF165 family)|nr:VUT family protein [Deltaproteobacteria bacterium]